VRPTPAPQERSASERGEGFGCYVYGVVEAGVSVPQNLRGLDGKPVTTVAGGSVAAVIGVIALERPPGRRADLVAHSEVLDGLAVETVVVPVQFGSILPDEGSVVQDFLLPNEQRFSTYLVELQGRAQFNLRATYHPDAALAEVVQTDPVIADLRRRTRELPEEEGYGLRVRLGELVAGAMERKREYDADVLLDAIHPFVAASSPRGGGGLDHVMEVALLVDDDRRNEFERQMEWLAEAVHERMRLRLMGPMAPYDFVEGE
jgi:Gas vesicle synthesis protein GvpL/GvpF